MHEHVARKPASLACVVGSVNEPPRSQRLTSGRKRDHPVHVCGAPGDNHTHVLEAHGGHRLKIADCG